MSIGKKVTILPVTRPLLNDKQGESSTRRVAGYARVSTEHDEQFTSYQAQINYYTNFIKKHSEWKFVKVYTDEGISGTQTKHRTGFRKMISDALEGKIDLILTKSVSRFARNTVDSLATIRRLKEHGVEVYFEKENIWTFDEKGELLITIMSSLAQEESRSISENCKWGQRKRFADGKPTVPFGKFLGYDRGIDGNLVCNSKQAEIIRRIYSMFLDGYTYADIACVLTADAIPTPSGKSQWRAKTVKSILTNEKYKGDAMLQKNFTLDFLTKKRKKNEGEIVQYYVIGNHEAIIQPGLFDFVQKEIAARKKRHTRKIHLFSGKIRCGNCGDWLNHTTQHAGTKYKKHVWQCRSKATKKHCPAKAVKEEIILQAFYNAVHKFICEKEDVISQAITRINCLSEEVKSLTRKIDEKQIGELCLSKGKSLLEEYTDRSCEITELRRIIELFQEIPCDINKIPIRILLKFVDFITVQSEQDIIITFRTGQCIKG